MPQAASQSSSVRAATPGRSTAAMSAMSNQGLRKPAPELRLRGPIDQLLVEGHVKAEQRRIAGKGLETLHGLRRIQASALVTHADAMHEDVRPVRR